jgi:hypothetical protein
MVRWLLSLRALKEVFRLKTGFAHEDVRKDMVRFYSFYIRNLSFIRGFPSALCPFELEIRGSPSPTSTSTSTSTFTALGLFNRQLRH